MNIQKIKLSVGAALGIAGAIVVALALPEIIAGKELCRRASAERERAQSLSSRLSVVLTGESSYEQSFQKLLKTGAVFKTKTRDALELQTDLSEVFAAADFTIAKIELLPGEILPVASDDITVQWEGKREVSELFVPDPVSAFSRQRWNLTLVRKNSTEKQNTSASDIMNEWGKATAQFKKSANVAFIEKQKTLQPDGTLHILLETGMIPGMKLPHRFYALPEPIVQEWKTRLAHQKTWVPDVFSSVQCLRKQDALYNDAQEKIETRRAAALERLEVMDRLKWLSIAEIQASAFLKEAGQL